MVWLASFVFSRKKMTEMKEKEGLFAVVLSWTFFLFFASAILVVIASIMVRRNHSMAMFRVLDVTTIVFFSITAVAVLEVIISILFGKKFIKKK